MRGDPTFAFLKCVVCPGGFSSHGVGGVSVGALLAVFWLCYPSLPARKRGKTSATWWFQFKAPPDLRMEDCGHALSLPEYRSETREIVRVRSTIDVWSLARVTVDSKVDSWRSSTGPSQFALTGSAPSRRGTVRRSSRRVSSFT